MYTVLTTSPVLSSENSEKEKFNRLAFGLVTKSQLCCVPARRNGRISSLTWTAYLCSSSLCRRFEIPSHSLGSCISHITQKAGKEKGAGGEKEKERSSKPAHTHAPPPHPGPHGPSLSVSQVTGDHPLS